MFELFSKNMMGIKRASSNLISFKLAADISWRMTAELMAPIFGQLNPDVIGSDYRDLQVATMYGERLAKVSKNPLPRTVHQLVSAYPSHDFIIDRDEALTLFRHVDEPTAELYAFVGLFTDAMYRQATPGIVMPCMPIENESVEEDSEDDSDENVTNDDKGTEVVAGGDEDRRRDQGNAEPSQASSEDSIASAETTTGGPPSSAGRQHERAARTVKGGPDD